MTVTRATGESLALVELIAASLEQRNIRAGLAQNAEAVLNSLNLELEFCARTYCGSSKTDERTFEEGVEFILSQFASLALGEIREAFRLAAAGKLGDVNMTTYYGLFTVAMLGDVLNSYTEYRRRTLSELRKMEALAEIPAKSWDKEAWGNARLEKFRNLETPTLDNFTATDYDYFHETGQLKHTDDEKKAAWADAYALTLADLEREAESEKSVYRVKELKDILAEAREKQFTETFTTRRAVIAKRLLVQRWAKQWEL